MNIIIYIFMIGFFINLGIYFKLKRTKQCGFFNLLKELNIESFNFLLIYQKVLFIATFILILLIFVSVII